MTTDKLDAVAVLPAVFLIDDSALAIVLKRLTRDPEAGADVQFFLDARGSAIAWDDPVRNAGS